VSDTTGDFDDEPDIAGYRVDDCTGALQQMIDAGAIPIDEKPRPGSRVTTSRVFYRRS